MKQLIVSLATLIVLGGCWGGTGTARRAGDAFVDAHYVRIDLEKSKELCTGLARQKVEAEIALTSEIEMDVDTKRPRINYDLHEERIDGDMVQLIYELTIRAPGVDPYSKFTIVTVRSNEDAWMVTNFMEMDSL